MHLRARADSASINQAVLKRSRWPILVAVKSPVSQHTHTYFSLRASALFSERQDIKDRYYVGSLILHASISEITAQLLSLTYVYLISSDSGSIIMIFVQINILERRAGYVVLMGHISVTISY